MSKYLLAYIDEQEDEREDFELYFDEYNDEFEITFILPGGKTVNQIIEEVIELNPDMVVMDFYLKYSDPTVPDNGDVLMQRVNDRKPLLPIVLLTSFMQKAEGGFMPPERRNSILDKSKLNDIKDPGFKNEIISYILYYRELLSKYKSEFAELSQKEEKSEEERARMAELDIILEGAVDRQSAIKSEHKTDEKLEELKGLITSTKDLLKEFKKDSNA